MANSLLDQWNPSRAINLGLTASGLAPTGISQFLNLGYGAYNGFRGLTSQNNEGFWGNLDPTQPGMLQNAGNWLGSGIAALLGYGNPQMSMAQGQAGDNQSFGSNMQGGGYNGGMVNVTPMQLNPNGSPSDAQLQWLNGLPSLNYGGIGGGSSSGGFNGVGYNLAAGGDFMTGFGSQAGGYEGGGSYPGLRTLVR